jgi:type VI secretion system protein ImpA
VLSAKIFMSSAATVDFEALLAPIAGSNPAGELLRDTPTYDAIKEARRSDDPTLSQGDWKRDVKLANWREAVKLATDAITNKSKDLQITVWLAEALVKQSGFAGLRDGLRILRELHERYWDTLYPASEDGDLEFRAAPIDWLNNTLPISLRGIGLTKPEGGESYSWLKWQESRAVEELGRKNADAKAAAVAEGKITAEQFEKAAAATPKEFYQNLGEELHESIEEFDKLVGIVDQKFGPEAPSLMELKKALEDCRDLVEQIIETKGGLESHVIMQATNGSVITPLPITASAPTVQDRLNTSVLAGQPADRAQALQMLEAIAQFFHRTEPHSPVAYLVERAVRWGQMPLEQWLNEVISDQSVLTHIRETLGIKNSEQTGG